MSEAQIYNNEQGLPERNEPNQAIESSADLTDSNPSPTIADNPAPGDESPGVEAGDVSGQIADALTWQSDLDVAELVTLSQSLQKQNSDLLSHIEQLEKLLDECHSALQLQMKRNQSLETRITQQTEELTSTQEQVTRLFRELEASHQVAQRQQILIETLNQQLENSQEQVAQLERECALAQQRSNEQAYSLSQSEIAAQELRSRLERQQRYTMQFKAALDKCLEVPGMELNFDPSNVPTTAERRYFPQNVSARQHLILKPQPIQPWSDRSDFAIESTDGEAIDSISVPAVNLPWEEQETKVVSTTPEDQPQTTNAPPTDLTVNQTQTTALPTDLPQSERYVTNFNELEEGLWEELERLTEAAVAQMNSTPIAENQIAADSGSLPERNLPEIADASDESISQTQETSAPVGESPTPEITTSSSIIPLDPNQSVALTQQYPDWPAPLVHPARPHKKIKSLSAIDLPSFPRLSPQ